jgi:hypothetical protein
MQHVVRIGRIKDQDRWRRDDLRKCTPAERVDMLLQMQAAYFAGQDRSLVRVAHIERLGRSRD